MNYLKDTYKKSLHEKAVILEKNILKRHNLMGLYPSMVEVPLDGSDVSHSTESESDVNHSVCWTSYHLSGASFRYAYLKKINAEQKILLKAKRRADELFEGAYRCLLITGGKGLQARGYRTGHGPTPEEYVEGNRTRNHWFQGTGPYKDLRWREDPSHHNYSHTSFGYGAYYRLAAEGEQKAKCAHALDISVGYWLDKGMTLYRGDDPNSGYPMFNLTDGKILTTSVLMVLGALKAAYHATGKDKFKKAYDQTVTGFRVRELDTLVIYKDFDDSSQVIIHLENLIALEQDRDLVSSYLNVLKKLWSIHKDDGQSLYNFIYLAHFPEDKDKEKIMNEAMKALYTWPTDMTIRPQMNSIDKTLKPPYPVYKAVFDNEYMWKGNLLRPDGWLSRTVKQVEVSNEDPYVLFALEENGSLYYSYDKAKTVGGWKHLANSLDGKIKKILQGKKTRIMIAMTDEKFYISTTVCRNWREIPIPNDGGKPYDILFDPKNKNVLYAITTRNVYRSRDIDEEFLAMSWECLTETLPRGYDMQFSIGFHEPVHIYAICKGVKKYHPTPTLFWETPVILVRNMESDKWEVHSSVDFAYSITKQYNWLCVDPFDSKHIYMGLYGIQTENTYDFAAVADDIDSNALSMISESFDCGKTWSLTMHKFYDQFKAKGFAGIKDWVIPTLINNNPIFDINRPNHIYAASDNGLLKSTDGGRTFSIISEGLDIKRIYTLSYDAQNHTFYAGTPGGLYISYDGNSFIDGNLTLQFKHNTRREIGGAAYLDAYWRALYYGLINEEVNTGHS